MIWRRALYYDRAKQAAMSNGHTFHIAAIVWRGSSVVIATNSYKKRKAFTRYYGSMQKASCTHAEMEASLHVKSGDRVEVLRWRKDGTLAMAKPCSHCQRFLKKAGVRQVRYSNDIGEFEYLTL